METTDNQITHGDTPDEETQIKHRSETGNILSEDDKPTQEQINEATGTNPVLDAPDQQKIDAEGNSGRQPIDGNGLREHDSEDVVEDEAAVEEATESQQDIAKREQDKQASKLNPNPAAKQE